jgi:site-specific DNA-methyltransferase (adenine-specific)
MTEQETIAAGKGALDPLVVRLSDSVTIIRGDCRDVLPVECDAVVTDPPYGMKWNVKRERHESPSSIKSSGGVYGREWGGIEGDDKPFDPALLLGIGKPLVTWGANHYASRLPDSPGWLIWDKKRGGTAGRGFTGSDCELAWCSETGDCTAIFCLYWDGFRRDCEVGDHFHPTQKPVALMSWCMDQAKIPEGATVLDPYMGSGTTGIACIRTGRKFIGIEIDAEYFDIARERLENELRQGLLPLTHNMELSNKEPNKEISGLSAES